VLNVPSMPAEALILVVLGGVRLCIWTRRWRWLGLAPIAAGYLTLAFVRPPDLLVVAESAQSEKSLRVAVRAADGSYLLSSARGSRITAETWTRRAAAESGPAWPAAGASADGALACDALGCLYGARGRVVALIRDGAALAPDCGAADLAVSPIPAHRSCPAPLVIDRIDAATQGAHAVWLDADGIRIETVAGWRGSRPWAPRRHSAIFGDRPRVCALGDSGELRPDNLWGNWVRRVTHVTLNLRRASVACNGRRVAMIPVPDGERADHQIMQVMAADCRQQAETAPSPARRAQLLEVAGHYERMAAAMEVLARRKSA
jgi:hypothetical protein